MQRREFLKRGWESAVLLYCAVELPPADAAAPPRPPALTHSSLTTLTAFIDTLIPADATPSASQLGLEPALRRHAAAIENYPRLLELGCEWLDATGMRLHRAGFAALPATRREAVVTLAETSPTNSIARIFFDRVRFDLFGLYYASPASWEGLGFDSPPQPVGYLNFAQPVKKPGHG